MIIYLIRHGKDNDNYRGGWSDLGLVEEGINQSKLLAQYLYKNREKYKIDTLISSDLRRAIETTQEIEKKLNISAKFSSEWRENNNGILSGMLNSEALQKYPKLFFNTLRMDEQYPRGESPVEFYNRIKESYNKLCNRVLNGEIGPNVMLVTHGGVINIIYHIVKGIKWTNKCSPLCKLTTTGIHTIEYKVDGWKITISNNIDHLQ
ncbi:histidine phosphatase family protein [Clostridium pasteurianum]|uniref:histidine phosphatase family protein n=1 Tax=Clostridium pasteurianum TaxID=1501 RepID=UPI002260CF6B|nr:histidine phosphatase family protein [Clostridium pasteurianum]UZW15394.1 histidine phosphatase family protein [Clostridium pasteurianum]